MTYVKVNWADSPSTSTPINAANLDVMETGISLAAKQVAVRTTATSAIANTETQVISYSIPANTYAAGDVWLIRAYYTRAGTNAATATARVRIGTTTLTGTIAATASIPGAATAVAGVIDAMVTIRTTGSGGTMYGSIFNLHSATSPVVANTAQTSINTTASNLIELTLVSGNANNNYTFQQAVIIKQPD